MTKRTTHASHDFDLSGGILCLNYANTVSQRRIPEQSYDNLVEYSSLIQFAQQSKVVSAAYARDLMKVGTADPSKAGAVLRAATLFREAVYRVFSAVAEGRQVPPRDLQLIEDFAGEAMRHRQLVPGRGTYRWEWRRDKSDALAYMLWPIASSAADLLTSERLKKVRLCEAKTCTWLFLDESRNHSRRWCDMKVCGNREKARRHYQRELIR
jgi:predicted RNA-binding Zn ribbon-like protein